MHAYERGKRKSMHGERISVTFCGCAESGSAPLLLAAARGVMQLSGPPSGAAPSASNTRAASALPVWAAPVRGHATIPRKSGPKTDSALGWGRAGNHRQGRRR